MMNNYTEITKIDNLRVLKSDKGQKISETFSELTFSFQSSLGESRMPTVNHLIKICWWAKYSVITDILSVR